MDPVLLLSALLLLAFGLIDVGTAEPGLLQDHLLRVGAALLALVLGHLLPPRLLLRYALHALVGVLLLLVLLSTTAPSAHASEDWGQVRYSSIVDGFYEGQLGIVDGFVVLVSMLDVRDCIERHTDSGYHHKSYGDHRYNLKNKYIHVRKNSNLTQVEK